MAKAIHTDLISGFAFMARFFGDSEMSREMKVEGHGASRLSMTSDGFEVRRAIDPNHPNLMCCLAEAKVAEVIVGRKDGSQRRILLSIEKPRFFPITVCDAMSNDFAFESVVFDYTVRKVSDVAAPTVD